MEQEQMGEALWELRVNLLRLAQSIVHNSHDAEDAVSTAMEHALRKGAALREKEKLRPWAMKITARCCYDLLRRGKRETPREFLPEGTALQSEGSLYTEITELPPRYGQVLILYYYEGFSTLEIASILRLTRPTVSMRLKRGREMLKQRLQEVEDDENESL